MTGGAIVARRSVAPAPDHGGKTKSLVEHAKEINPKKAIQHVIAAGHYFEAVQRMPGFKTKDISEAFKQMRYAHSNPSEAVRQARAQGFLMDGPEGTLQLTRTAMSWVDGQLSGSDESDE